MDNRGKLRIGMVGGGWRAEFYLRIARALPERFEVSNIYMRDEAKGREVNWVWGVPVTTNWEAFLKQRDFDFVVLSLPRTVTPEYLVRLAAAGIPVLTETPPAVDLSGLYQLYETVGSTAKIQVAEQFLFQPMHAARLAVARSGLLGEVSHVQVSAGHGYHGISLIRQLLGVGFEEAEIRGEQISSPLVQGPGRGGWPEVEQIVTSSQTIALLRFGERTALFDFTYDQYFSPIRRHRVLVRGVRGEIDGTELRYLRDFRTPVELQLRRVDAGQNGSLLGYYHEGVLAGSEWVYVNPFRPGRLTDEEIAIATSLEKMGQYVHGGPSFYSLAEAAQDQYLSLMMEQAVQSGQTVRTERQPWAIESQKAE
ncbi:Gfo/Idh/MocA family protein [Paenibacillus barengoltzii]|jgi:predicted dehydrogenase|uniref:Gfo/Idh/MocA family protein n=1 Tax=Paenibacillus barengoltzii TaxID=343517 RepID=UPI000FD6EEF7|nr:Gfo/Idh/MocA family oxidoreductase [Paenibacillus barengoltzii]